MSRRLASGHFIALAIWVAIFGAIYFYFEARQKPTIVVAKADLDSGEVVIPRSRDGHYYVRGAINGHPIDFMVDTGASIVSISRDTAQSAGLIDGMPANFVTANGTVAGRIVPGQIIEAGGIVMKGLSIGVGIHGDIALLGQNFLRKVDILQSGDKMVLRIPGADP
jgi:aspartyl protease family protein